MHKQIRRAKVLDSKHTAVRGETAALGQLQQFFSPRSYVCLCLDLINFFGLKVFFRMWFQEYKEVAILNLISFMVLLY